jgi:hypothetical protein
MKFWRWSRKPKPPKEHIEIAQYLERHWGRAGQNVTFVKPPAPEDG